MMRSVLIGAALAASLGLPNTTAAQRADPAPGQAASAESANDAEGRALFEAGRAAYDVGRYASALSRFQEAYELTGHAQLLYNIGQCYDRLRRDAEAVEMFERYLAEVPDNPQRAALESRLATIRERMEAEEAARLDAEAAARDEALRAAEQEAAGRTGRARRTTGIIALAGGVALGGVGGALMAVARSDANAIERRDGATLIEINQDTAAAERRWRAGQALVYIGAAAAAVGVVLVITGRPGDDGEAPEAGAVQRTLSINGRGASFRRTF
jgi:tetratricopeptide (TPR) repeat protein